MATGGFITDAQRRQIIQMRADAYSIRATALAVGVSTTAVWVIAPGWRGKVSNVRLRAAFLESGVSASEVARAIGWEWKCGERFKADSSRVRRTLGLVDEVNGRGFHSTRHLIDWETGSLIAEAIGVAAWSVLSDGEEAA